MNATLTLDLFRPSILDPIEAGEHLRASRGGAVRDRGPAQSSSVPEPVGGDLQVQDRRSAASGGPTLDDLVVGVWEGLTAHRTVACLACGEAMVPRYGAGHAPVGGRCSSCGTTIH
jgi:hypothetical protein